MNLLNIQYRNEMITSRNAEARKYQCIFNKWVAADTALFSNKVEALKNLSIADEIIASITGTPLDITPEVEKIIKTRNIRLVCKNYAKIAEKNSIKTGIKLGVSSVLTLAGTQTASFLGKKATEKVLLNAAAKSTVAVARSFAPKLVTTGISAAVGRSLVFLGPVGWGLTALQIGYAGYKMNSDNEDIAFQAKVEAQNIKLGAATLNKQLQNMNTLAIKITTINESLPLMTSDVHRLWGADYKTLNDDEKRRFFTFVNCASGLASLIMEGVSYD